MTTRYTVTWPNGEKGTVEITAAHPNDLVSVRIYGQLSRLATLPTVARPSLLGSYVQHLVDRDRASFTIEHVGEYADEADVR